MRSPRSEEPSELHERAKLLFLAAREHPAGAREDFVAERCGSDERLRQEVLSLLATEVGGQTRWLRAPALGASDTARAEAAAPRWIGPYEILASLGAGGMGRVYLAEQHEPVRRKVALKVVKLGMDTRQVLVRFEQERQALALMDHPHIAKVLDAGATAQGQPYFVMEHVEGVAVTKYCDAKRLTLARRLALMEQICHGVQHAHLKGVIHRDLKPTNILVSEHDGAPFCKIIDFGLARATETKLEGLTLLTQQGQILGTPEYMSPEQADTAGLDVDTRTDVYSLGVILYELLTGALPLSSEELRQAGLVEIQRRLREEAPPKPSTKITTLRASSQAAAEQRGLDKPGHSRALRGELDWITMKALEKDRTRRYQTPNELAEDLRRHLEHEPVKAGPPSAAYRLKKLVRRYRAQVLAGCAILLTAVLGAGAAVGYAVEAESRRRQAQANLDLFDLLSDVVRLREAKESQLALYPALPSIVQSLRLWLDSARPLAQRLAVVSAARDEVRARTLAALSAASRPASVTASQAAALLPLGHPDRFLLETLNALVTGLDAFTGEKGELRSVEARLREAETIEQRSIGDHRARWDEAIAAIAKSDDVVASKLYAGLKIKPQLGLVPVGMDAASKLWEFSHLASGEIAKRRARDKKMFLKDETGIVFVLLPAGEFWMGAQRDDPKGQNYDPEARRNESPPHSVTLTPFFLSKYEMTQGQWLRLSSGEKPSWHRVGSRYRGEPVFIGYTHPVENVDWLMCDALMTQQGLCLPSEAQWEYGCRGGSNRSWWPGDSASDLAGCGNVLDQTGATVYPQWGPQQGDFDDGHVEPAPAGQYRANGFGLHDVHGNLREWCRDWMHSYSKPPDPHAGPPSDYSGDRVTRGGCFLDRAQDARSAIRLGGAPSFRNNDLGLRAAREVAE